MSPGISEDPGQWCIEEETYSASLVTFDNQYISRISDEEYIQARQLLPLIGRNYSIEYVSFPGLQGVDSSRH